MNARVSRSGWIILIGGAIVAAGLIAGRILAQDQCLEYVGDFAENFDTVDFKDEPACSIANWPAGPVRLNYNGGNFGVLEPAGMGALIYVADAGDFDGDGLPDLIGLDRNGFRLVLIRNRFVDADGDTVDDDGIVFQVDNTEVYETGLDAGPASLTVGDFNHDGKLDFFFLSNLADAFSYSQFRAYMYINVGTPTDPDFRTHGSSPNLDFTSMFQSNPAANGGPIYINWAGDHISAVDVDKDSDDDLLIISQDKIFKLVNPGSQWDRLDRWSIDALRRNKNNILSTGFTTGRGGTAVKAADFDGDGDLDIVAGTVMDVPYLVYFKNAGTGYYSREEIPIPNPDCTGTVALSAKDFNNDGRVDIFGATDRWNAGNEAHMWWYRNGGVDHGTVGWGFRCLYACMPILPDPHDVDMSACLDFDDDGDYDVVLNDANHSGDYYLVVNGLADVYALTGTAQSLDCTPDLEPTTQVITRVQATRLHMGVWGADNSGLQIQLFVSNDDGIHWEEYGSYRENELSLQADLPVHNFQHFGKHLRWKAVLQAEDDAIPDLPFCSNETPLLHEVQLRYWYVDRREYSRSSLVAAQVETAPGRVRKLLLAGTFVFPGWQGHLRAYDVTNVTAVDSPYTVLRTISRSTLPDAPGREMVAAGTELLWDAGEILNARSAGDRIVYTALDESGTLERLEFATANAPRLAVVLQDPDNDTEGLIGFVRGEGRDWKLGDIDHSTPLLVGPPEGSAPLMGDGYADFKNAHLDRIKVLYVGANDGMLHAFDPRTGEELWAFIPQNLLGRLKDMWRKIPGTDERVYSRNVYVDGSPVVSDAYINGDWRTVLICGQGAGKSNDNDSFYFALDITDPLAPQPLWEFTDVSAEFAMGESWSRPMVGKVVVEGADTWMAFMGSGYDTAPAYTAGRSFYAVRIADGACLFRTAATEVPTTPNIPNSLPASPSSLDIDKDGRTDRVYFADLEGRVYKLDTSVELTINGDRTSWDNEVDVIYEDSRNYPIVTKPIAWVNLAVGISVPRVFFGTGGDDAAPAGASYSFVAVVDSPSDPQVEWFMGDPAVTGLSADLCAGSLGAGEKVWADPVIPPGDGTVYFSTLQGNIENVNPCLNLGAGKLYGRYIQARPGVAIGGTVFKNELTGELQENLALASKARQAVTLGERTSTESGAEKREIYVQEYDSTIQRIEQMVGAKLKVRSWREVYQIIR